MTEGEVEEVDTGAGDDTYLAAIRDFIEDLHGMREELTDMRKSANGYEKTLLRRANDGVEKAEAAMRELEKSLTVWTNHDD